jgi:glutamine synthetase
LISCAYAHSLRVAKAAGAEFLVGIETEFILLKSTDPIEPVNDDGFCMSSKLSTGSTPAIVLEEIADALETSGIQLLMYHAEAAPGQVRYVPLCSPRLQSNITGCK